MAEVMKENMKNFKKDSEELCESKGIIYSKKISEQDIEYFNRRIFEGDCF